MFDWNLMKKTDQEDTGSVFSLKSLFWAVPAVWLGGCLATNRPAWFMRRSTAYRLKERMQDAMHMKHHSKWAFWK